MLDPESGPFGNSDGSRAHLEDLQKGFVRFDNEDLWGGIATRRKDRSARIIVGRKGSGKTLYLRRLRAGANEEDSLYADEIEREGLRTESVVLFCDTMKDGVLSESWMLLWRKAIILSVISHITCSPKLKDMCPPEFDAEIKKSFRRIVPEFITPVNAYHLVTQIIEEHRTKHKIDRYFNDPLWAQLEWLIKANITCFPPLCFYLDAVDEEYEKAPTYWLECQTGLFNATMRLLRDDKLGGRLLVFICILNFVMTSVLRSVHATRFMSEEHIRVLNWNREAIRLLLRRKIEMLDDDFFRESPENGRNVASWLGRKTIFNPARGVTEPIEQYLLRHTRLLPRDIIILGNALCKVIQRVKSDPENVELDVLIRQTVAEKAKRFGNEQLRICSKQVATDQMPAGAAQQGYTSSYIDVPEYTDEVYEELKTLIGSIGKDRFTLGELKSAIRESKKLFGEESDAFSVLWQNGLLGYVEKSNGNEVSIFYSERMDDLKLPEENREYAFHSCLIDSVGIQSVGKNPIY